MKQFTHDASHGIAAGLGWALLSAASFGTSGALGRGLMDSGWSAGGAVAARVSIAALVLLIPAWIALDGRWALLRAELGTVVAYGLVAVAGCQLAYFNAIQHMEVGAALLIEYAAPVAVLGWAWLRHGQRPGRLTVLGSALAVLGLVLVLDVVSGASVSIPGVAWALGAMLGAAVYFILSARRSELPPLVLAGGGLAVAAFVLVGAGIVGVLDLSVSTSDVDYSGTTVPFWAPLLALGLLSGAIAYVSGIAASRRLGSRVASFVALIEVLFALGFAWLLLRELPGGIQFAGAGLVLVGVIAVKAGEKQTARPQVAPEPDALLAEAA